MDNNKKLKFLMSVKKAQIKRLMDAGYLEYEAECLWQRYKFNYLESWREFVEMKLVALPEGLGKVTNRDINNIAREI